MQNSDLKNVLIAAIETADSRLLSMLYAVIKTYQITGTPAVTVQRDTPKPEPVATQVAAPAERVYKDERPRRVVRIYRKPQDEVDTRKVVQQAPAADPVPAQRVVRVSTTPTPATTRTRVVRSSDDSVSGDSNNGGFITDLMTKTVLKNGLPA